MYTEQDYLDAINFALNYPDKYHLSYYSEGKDIYTVHYLEGGWYIINLQGKFVRSCLKWKGIKKWKKNIR